MNVPVAPRCDPRVLHATRRLALLRVTPEMKAAFAQSRELFAAAIGAMVPIDWPQFPQAFEPGTGDVQPARRRSPATSTLR